jgi:hypothetical protein
MPRLFQISNRKKALAKVAWLAGVVAALGMTQASASIIQADISADAILEEITSGQPSSSSSPSRPADDADHSPEQVNDLADQALCPGSPTNSSTSSPTSSSSGGQIGALTCFTSALLSIESDSTSAWLRVRQSLFLPMPLGTDLLRPPRLSR